jgi:branched-chain amino acid aminotransferase
MMVDVIEKMDEDGEGGRFKRYLSEASAANVFIVKGGVLKTPDLECNCLNGVTRNAIIRLAREKGLTVIEGKITEKELMDADEVFETGTAAGVIAITSINGKKIGNGTEGEMTRMLREAYNNEVIPRSLTFIRETAVIPAERRKVPVS